MFYRWLITLEFLFTSIQKWCSWWVELWVGNSSGPATLGACSNLGGISCFKGRPYDLIFKIADIPLPLEIDWVVSTKLLDPAVIGRSISALRSIMGFFKDMKSPFWPLVPILFTEKKLIPVLAAKAGSNFLFLAGLSPHTYPNDIQTI